jgi:hypothetical protein
MICIDAPRSFGHARIKHETKEQNTGIGARVHID